MFSHIPIIDVSPLVAGDADLRGVATEIGCACRETGFFYIVGHGVDEALQARLETLSREFFLKPVEEKWRIRMALAGRAWRGYFRVGDELTSGRPDQKEGSTSARNCRSTTRSWSPGLRCTGPTSSRRSPRDFASACSTIRRRSPRSATG